MKKILVFIFILAILLSGCGISIVSNNFPDSPGERAYKNKVMRWSAAGALLFLLSGAAHQAGKGISQ